MRNEGQQNAKEKHNQRLRKDPPAAHAPLALLDHSPPTSVGSGQGDGA